MHARGFGAHGYFENYEALSELTMADTFQEAGRRTRAFVPVLVQSRAAKALRTCPGTSGASASGFTQSRELGPGRQQYPRVLHPGRHKVPRRHPAAKEEPDKGFLQAQSAHDNFWDFVSLTPESTNMLM